MQNQNGPHQYPQYQGYQPPPPPPPTPEQLRQHALGWIKQLRSDVTQAFNPYSLQKAIDGTLQIIEFILNSGRISTAHPNQVPGQPVNPLDTGKARVEFFAGPGVGQPQPLPSPPITNGDVQFVPGSGPATGGQTVEYYAGPPGSPYNSGDPNGQRVEYYGAPAPQGPQTQPTMVLPGPANTLNNPPQAQLVPGRPPVTVEAGEKVPGLAAAAPMTGLPIAQPFAQVMPAPGSPDHRKAPEPSREELISMLPIPML